MIEVISLHKKFDQDDILNDINTVFEKGKTNLIIGQSGSGKTVLLKCLLGLYNINSGEFPMMAFIHQKWTQVIN